MISTKKKKAILCALIYGILFSGGRPIATAAPEPEEQLFSLDEIVVTATRTEKNLLDVPASVSVITKEDMQARNINTMRDALKTQPGLYVDPTDQPYGGIQLRGFSSAEVLVLYDGQPMNNSWNGEVNWDSIPVEQVERIEIVRGAASALYGGRAVGGVINIISKKNDEQFSGSAAVNYGSNNTWKKAIAFDGKVNDKLSISAGYETRTTDGYSGYRSTVSKTSGSSAGLNEVTVPQLSNGKYLIGGRGKKEWNSDNYSTSVKYDFDENRSLKYSYTRSEYDYKYNNPFSYVKDANGNVIFGGGSFVTQNGDVLKFYPGSYLGYVGERETNIHVLNYNDKKNKINFNMGMQDIQKDGYSLASSSATSLDYNGQGTLSRYPSKNYNADFQKTWENVGSHTITAGVNWKNEQMTRTSFDLDHWKDWDSITKSRDVSHGKTQAIALFIQDEYKLNDPVTLYFGGRYDSYKKYDGYAEIGATNHVDFAKENYHEFSPKVAVEYRVNDTLSYFASYGHSFNAPRLYWLYRQTSSATANPFLKPETSDTFEIGVKKNFDKTTVGLSAYHVKTKDVIYSAKDSAGNTIYLNGSEGKKKGVELDLTHELNQNLNAYLNYAWEEGTNIPVSGMSQLNYNIPKHLLHMGLDYNKDQYNIVLDAQYVSERQAPDAVTGEYNSEDAFFVVNTYINYKLTPETTLQFGIENLLDRKFYAGEATKDRTYNIGLRYTF